MKSNSYFKLALPLCILLCMVCELNSVRLSTKASMNLSSQTQVTARTKLVVLNGIIAKDVGIGIMDAGWICGMDGRIYRFDPMNIVHNVLNNPPRCIRIDTDYEALPWIITSGHQIWRMVHEMDENFRWLRMDGKLLNFNNKICI